MNPAPTFAPDSIAFPRDSTLVRNARLARRLVFTIVCALALTVEGWALFVQQAGTPQTLRSRRVGAIAAFGAGARITQSFVSTVENLDGLTVWFASARGAIVTRVECELLPAQPNAPNALARSTDTLTISGRTAHTFAFAPLPGSNGKTYRLVLRALDEANGASVERSIEDAIPGHRLIVDSREEWGDLAMRTRGATMFRAFLARNVGASSAVGMRWWWAAALWLGLNLACMTFLYYVVVAREDEWTEGRLLGDYDNVIR